MQHQEDTFFWAQAHGSKTAGNCLHAPFEAAIGHRSLVVHECQFFRTAFVHIQEILSYIELVWRGWGFYQIAHALSVL